MLAIMGVVLLINRQSAGFFELMLFFLSIPVIVYEVKYGAQMAATLSVSAILLSFLLSTPTSVFYMCIAMFTGFVYGYGVLHDWKNQTLLLITIGVNLIAIYLTAVVFASIFGYNLNEEINEILNLLPKGDIGNMSLRKFVEEIVLISYIGISVVQALAIHLIANQMLTRFKLKVKTMVSLFEFRFPKFLSIIIIAVFFLYVGSSYVNVSSEIQQGILGLYAICLLVAITDGALTILCYLKLKHNKQSLVFIAVFACFIPVIQNLIALLGVFDIYEGVRAKMKVGVSYEIHRKN